MTREVRRCNIAALCVERELIYISFQSYCSLVLVDVTCSGSKKSDYIPLSDQLQLWCGFIVWPLQGWLRKWLRLVCFLVLLAFSLHVKILLDNMSLIENRVISGKSMRERLSKFSLIEKNLELSFHSPPLRALRVVCLRAYCVTRGKVD